MLFPRSARLNARTLAGTSMLLSVDTCFLIFRDVDICAVRLHLIGNRHEHAV